MRKIKRINWSLNLWLSYIPVAIVSLDFGWKCFVGFTIGAIGSELSLIMMIKDIEHLKLGGIRALRFGFLKRYTLSIIILGISATLSIESLVFAFLGLELLRLTLSTFARSGEI